MGGYTKLKNIVKGLDRKVDWAKDFYSENKAIGNKRKLYRNVIWSTEEQLLFDDYWISNYGKKIPNKWHRLYQNCCGIFNERYFPDILYSTKLAPIINPTDYCEVLSDKNLLHTLFDLLCEKEHGYIPNTILSCKNGIYQNGENIIIPRNEAIEILSNLSEVVIKPTIDTGSGKDVNIISMVNGRDTKTRKDSKDLLTYYGDNFVIQEKIHLCKELEKLSPTCVSTFRVVTYIANDDVFCAPIALRLGTGEAEIDNIHAGGIGVGVEDNGVLMPYAYKLGYGDNCVRLSEHPDTHIQFNKYRIPSVPQIIKLAKLMHSLIPQIGMISWDFTVDNMYRAVLIEINCTDQAVWFTQMVTGKPIFGNNTSYFLNMIKPNRNRLN